jgi:hypothetical protein
VLPIVLILLALLIALYVSGVFGGNDPASSPNVIRPAATPAAKTTSALVAVPGAKTASGEAVEVAKARERARERGDSGAAKRDAASASNAQKASTPAAASPPPAPATTPPAAPAVGANNAVKSPAPKRDTSASADGSKQIDAGSGATGAEQIPPAGDASNVPDLAPPPENATTP